LSRPTEFDPVYLGKMITKKDEERFLSRVDKATTPAGCWLFTGYRNKAGYGSFWVNGRYRRATHIALELVGWIIPFKRLQVRHYICDNPPCVRPSHLRIGTHGDNMVDMVTKGRQARGERLAGRPSRPRVLLDMSRALTMRSEGKSIRAIAQTLGASTMVVCRALALVPKS
jgi:hypothetical protein